MYNSKRNSRLETWLKLQRKIKSLSCRIDKAICEKTRRHLIRKLKMLVRRLFNLNRKWRLGIAAATLFMWLGTNNINAQSILDHTNLNGNNGFKITSGIANGKLGFDISDAGDFNGDGLQDLIVSSCDKGKTGSAGGAYVIFGTDGGFDSAIDVSTLNGSNGFSISDSIVANRTGISVSSAGDFNGDGFDDLIIGESLHDYNSGRVYIILGNNQNNSEVDLNNLNGTNGFQINADSKLGPYGRPLYYLGESVAGVGDINSDGFDDISFSWAYQLEYGFVSILYGSDSSYNPVNHIDSLNNPNQLTVMEAPLAIAYHTLGGDPNNNAISHGDINGDGIDDVVLGHASMNGDEGAVYVVFGSDQQLPDTLKLDALDGQTGFQLAGYEYYGYLGVTVDVADINGDGFDDILAGNHITGYNYYNAKVTVLFGKESDFTAVVKASDLNGNDGFKITGLNMDPDYCTVSVSAIEDVNGDGIDDIMIGVDDIMVNTKDDAGRVYVVFGNDGTWPANYDIGTLNSNSGFIINGTAVDEQIGSNIAGIDDLNGDGVGDFAFAGAKGEEAFVVFGSAPLEEVAFEDLDISKGFTARSDKQYLFLDQDAIGDFNGDGKDDIVVAKQSESWLLFGKDEPVSSIVSLDTLNGSNGFSTTSPENNYAIALVDINADGFDDIVLGQPYNYSGGTRGGKNYILFGNSGAQDSIIDLENPGTNPMHLLYSDVQDKMIGSFLFNAGDINGDGFDDLYTVHNDYGYSGSVIFANENLPDSLNLESDLDSNNGFTIIDPGEQHFKGDINGDGKSDIVLKRSSVYWSVILGQDRGVINEINPNNLNGTNGFEIEIWAGVASFEELNGILDFNNDGYDDLLYRKSRSYAPSWGNDSIFMIYGHDAPFPDIDLDGGQGKLDGSNGAVISGLPVGELINSVTTLDFNNDESDDVILSLTPSNEVYIVYGNNNGVRATDISNMQPSQGFKIQGFGSNPLSVQKGGDLNGDGFSDLIIMDKMVVDSSERAVARIVYGQNTDKTIYDINELQKNGGYDLIFSDSVSEIDNFHLLDYNGDGYNDVLFSIYEPTYTGFKFLLSETTCNAIRTTENLDICSGEDYTFPDGTTQRNITTDRSHQSIFTSVNGCDSTITTNIHVNSVDLSVIVDGNTLTANEANADAYQWIYCDLNLSIDGETNYTFDALKTGNYSLIIENNNCVDTTACNQIDYMSVTFNSDKTQKILFVGNSYTSANNLPGLVSQVAASVGDVLSYDSHTPGGATLSSHAGSSTVDAKIKSDDWDFVVLQAQSQEPSWGINQVSNQVFPYAEMLCNSIRANSSCSMPLFYMTWGRENGDSYNCANLPSVCSYEGMDSLLNLRYRMMAEDNNANVSPVGAVWHYLRDNNPSIDLYSADGSHPSLTGSYAAAVTFYTMIYKKDPTLITFDSSLSATDATIIKNAVKSVVFDEISTWLNETLDFETVSGPKAIGFSPSSPLNGTYIWDFGDGETQTAATPTHVYETVGDYLVSMKRVICGDTLVVSKSVFVTEDSDFGQSCAFPIEISSLGKFDVDNSAGDQWFSYIAPGNGLLEVSTCDLNNGEDTHISLYENDCATIITSNDDSDCGKAASIRNLSVSEGDILLIKMDFANTNGTYQFEVKFTVVETVEKSICDGNTYLLPDGVVVSEEGSYTSNIVAISGYDSIITTNIHVNSVDLSVIVDGNTLTANEANADAYQWIDCDLNLPVEGETNQTFVALETGTYSVVIEDNNCIDTSVCNSIIISGIDHTQSIVQSIWPNPTSGKINIKVSENKQGIDLFIHDMNGRVLLTKEIVPFETSISVELPGVSGVYFVQLKSDLKTETFKIIKK